MQKMTFIKWHEYNETGIIIIDEQHKGIVSIINTLFYLMSIGYDNGLHLRVINAIKNYSSIHFITEENLLETSEFKDTEEHKEQHRKLIHDLEQIERNEIKVHEVNVLLDFLKKWWIEHINEQDQLYAQHLRESVGAY